MCLHQFSLVLLWKHIRFIFFNLNLTLFPRWFVLIYYVMLPSCFLMLLFSNISFAFVAIVLAIIFILVVVNLSKVFTNLSKNGNQSLSSLMLLNFPFLMSSILMVLSLIKSPIELMI